MHNHQLGVGACFPDGVKVHSHRHVAAYLWTGYCLHIDGARQACSCTQPVQCLSAARARPCDQFVARSNLALMLHQGYCVLPSDVSSSPHNGRQRHRDDLLPFWQDRECLQPPCQGVYKPLASPILGLLDPDRQALLTAAQPVSLLLEACLAAGGALPIKASLNEKTQACVPDEQLLISALS